MCTDKVNSMMSDVAMRFLNKQFAKSVLFSITGFLLRCSPFYSPVVVWCFWISRMAISSVELLNTCCRLLRTCPSQSMSLDCSVFSVGVLHDTMCWFWQGVWVKMNIFKWFYSGPVPHYIGAWFSFLCFVNVHWCPEGAYIHNSGKLHKTVPIAGTMVTWVTFFWQVSPLDFARDLINSAEPIWDVHNLTVFWFHPAKYYFAVSPIAFLFTSTAMARLWCRLWLDRKYLVRLCCSFKKTLAHR